MDGEGRQRKDGGEAGEAGGEAEKRGRKTSEKRRGKGRTNPGDQGVKNNYQPPQTIGEGRYGGEGGEEGE